MEGNCIFVFQITHEGGERLVCRRAASGLFNSCTAFTSRRLFDSVQFSKSGRSSSSSSSLPSKSFRSIWSSPPPPPKPPIRRIICGNEQRKVNTQFSASREIHKQVTVAVWPTTALNGQVGVITSLRELLQSGSQLSPVKVIIKNRLRMRLGTCRKERRSSSRFLLLVKL